MRYRHGTDGPEDSEGDSPRALRERGAAAVEAAGLTVLATLIILAVVATPAAKTMTTYTGSMVDKILDTKDEIKSGPSTMAFGGAAGAPSKKAADAVNAAMSQLGKPYEWGAEGPNTFDCSGLMLWAYNQAGVSIQRTARQQFLSQPKVSRSDLKPGDLVYFNTEPGPGPTHVGMYIGNGNIVQAPHTGDVVKVTPVAAFGSQYAGATRPTG